VRVNAALVTRDPLYVRLASEFRRQIDSGVLRAGDKLPSIRSLRRGRRVSAATVTEAYLRLERDGYVRARDRSGFYVAQPPARALPEPCAPNALVPPVPVGISELVAEVLRQTGDTKLVPFGVSTLGSSFFPTARINRAFRQSAARWPLHSATYGPPRPAASPSIAFDRPMGPASRESFSKVVGMEANLALWVVVFRVAIRISVSGCSLRAPRPAPDSSIPCMIRRPAIGHRSGASRPRLSTTSRQGGRRHDDLSQSAGLGDERRGKS
jgi:DNA-binding transcriptional regulator YhcF (GntR family)